MELEPPERPLRGHLTAAESSRGHPDPTEDAEDPVRWPDIPVIAPDDFIWPEVALDSPPTTGSSTTTNEAQTPPGDPAAGEDPGSAIS